MDPITAHRMVRLITQLDQVFSVYTCHTMLSIIMYTLHSSQNNIQLYNAVLLYIGFTTKATRSTSSLSFLYRHRFIEEKLISNSDLIRIILQFLL